MLYFLDAGPYFNEHMVAYLSFAYDKPTNLESPLHYVAQLFLKTPESQLSITRFLGSQHSFTSDAGKLRQ